MTSPNHGYRRSGRRRTDDGADPPGRPESSARTLLARVVTEARLVRKFALDAARNVRAEFESSEWLSEHLEHAVGRLRFVSAVASDTLRYARLRLRPDATKPSDRLSDALGGMVVDAANELNEVMKELAVCLADRKRFLRTHEAETNTARAVEQEAASADQQGQHQLAHERSAQAAAHRDLAQRAQLAADELSPQIELLTTRVRTFKSAIDDAKIAVEKLRADERLLGTEELIERQTRRLQRVTRILSSISVFRENPDGAYHA